MLLVCLAAYNLEVLNSVNLFAINIYIVINILSITTVLGRKLCMKTWYNSKICMNFVPLFSVIFWAQTVTLLVSVFPKLVSIFPSIYYRRNGFALITVFHIKYCQNQNFKYVMEIITRTILIDTCQFNNFHFYIVFNFYITFHF